MFFVYIFEMLVFVILQLRSKLQELSLYKLLHLLLLLLYFLPFVCSPTLILHDELITYTLDFRFRLLLLLYWFTIIFHLHFVSM